MACLDQLRALRVGHFTLMARRFVISRSQYPALMFVAVVLPAFTCLNMPEIWLPLGTLSKTTDAESSAPITSTLPPTPIQSVRQTWASSSVSLGVTANHFLGGESRPTLRPT